MRCPIPSQHRIRFVCGWVSVVTMSLYIVHVLSVHGLFGVHLDQCELEYQRRECRYEATFPFASITQFCERNDIMADQQ